MLLLRPMTFSAWTGFSLEPSILPLFYPITHLEPKVGSCRGLPHRVVLPGPRRGCCNDALSLKVAMAVAAGTDGSLPGLAWGLGPSHFLSGFLASQWLCKGITAIFLQLNSQASEFPFILGFLPCVHTHACTHVDILSHFIDCTPAPPMSSYFGF